MSRQGASDNWEQIIMERKQKYQSEKVSMFSKGLLKFNWEKTDKG